MCNSVNENATIFTICFWETYIKKLVRVYNKTRRLPSFRDFLVFAITWLSQNLNFVAIPVTSGNKETHLGNCYLDNSPLPPKETRPETR